MQNPRPSRGSSIAGAIAAAVMVVWGILWTIFAYWLTSMSPFPFVHVIFPAFGLLFIGLGVFMFISSIASAINPNRAGPGGFAGPTLPTAPRRPIGTFCPFCSAPITDEFAFCSKCGKHL